MRPAVLALAALLAQPAAAETLRLAVTFDPPAAQQLDRMGEMVVVNAVFFGDPAKGNWLPLDEMGQVWLGGEEFTVFPTPQSLVIGSSLAGAPFEAVVAPIVNVNVYSARLADDNNLLDCGIVEGPVAELARREQHIHCRLLGQ
jgi:hypothetical protein